MRSRFRRFLSFVRHAPDRLAHPFRRAAARRGLARLRPVRSVVFVCHGNVCRSPYAAALFAGALADRGAPDVDILSAGFVGPNRGSPEEAVEVARERGLDLTGHRSRLIRDVPGPADLAVVMEPRQKRDLVRSHGYDPHAVLVLGDLDPRGIRKRVVLDPWSGDADLFRASYDRIDRCMAAFNDVLLGHTDDASATGS